MDSIRLEFTGMKELEAKFNELTQIERIRFFAEMFSPIGNKIVSEMRSEAPQSKRGVTDKRYPSRTHPAGTLRKSIGKAIGGDDIPTMWVSPRRKEKKGADAWYSHLVIGGKEYGGSRSAPNPFVRRTFDKMEPWIRKQLEAKTMSKLKSMLQ